MPTFDVALTRPVRSFVRSATEGGFPWTPLSVPPSTCGTRGNLRLASGFPVDGELVVIKSGAILALTLTAVAATVAMSAIVGRHEGFLRPAQQHL